MVKHTAHNGKAVGSNPTRLKCFIINKIIIMSAFFNYSQQNTISINIIKVQTCKEKITSV